MNGQYKQAMGFEDRVYWRYNSRLLENSRGTHRAMHGFTAHKDHSFWDKNMPMCDYNCKCFLTFHTKEECESNGWSIITSPMPNIAKNGFDYDKRGSWSGRGISKVTFDDSMRELPLIQGQEKYRDKGNWSEAKLLEKFFKDFGVKNGDTYIDKTGDPLVISDALFKVVKAGGDELKITKLDRHLFLDYFTSVIKNPDEIYLEVEKLDYNTKRYLKGNQRLLKKFFKYYKDKNGKTKALMAIFTYREDEEKGNKTQGVTIYCIDKFKAFDKKRIEKLIYRKD